MIVMYHILKNLKKAIFPVVNSVFATIFAVVLLAHTSCLNDDSKVSGEKTVRLNVCELSPLVERIVEESILPELSKAGENPEKYFVNLFYFENDTLQALFGTTQELDFCCRYIHKDYLWFERKGYQFLVEDAPEELLHKTKHKRTFKYYYKYYDLMPNMDHEYIDFGYKIEDNYYTMMYCNFFRG